MKGDLSSPSASDGHHWVVERVEKHCLFPTHIIELTTNIWHCREDFPQNKVLVANLFIVSVGHIRFQASHGRLISLHVIILLGLSNIVISLIKLQMN